MIGAVDLERAALDELRSQLRTEQYASWIAAIVVAVLGAIVGAPWGIALGGLVAVGALVRLPAFRAVDRDQTAAAIWWVAAGTWGIAMCVVAIVPPAFPIMILNLIGPLVTGAVYLDARRMRSLIVAGVVVAVAMGVVGYRSDGTGLEDSVADWFFQLVMITYLAAHVIVASSVVSVANRVRLAALTQALAVNDELVRSEAELRASRRRVINAGDEERVRIERDIHDGAQQRLVALAVQLKLAGQMARDGTPVTDVHLDGLHEESRAAIEELRELARGIYPPALAERGLEDALRGVARRSPNPVEVNYDPAVVLAPNDAAAVYFVCSEALQNIAKHAGSDAAARVDVARVDGRLVVEITDDGPGFDHAVVASSRGLLNMADRAGALGGHLTVRSTPGVGTTITMVVDDRPPANVST